MTVKSQPDFAAVHARLKQIMQKYEKGVLKAQTDTATNYELVAPPIPLTKGKPFWFGAVKTGKAYVSYHLMAVYAHPALLEGISPELRKRMQGKSCFNFRAIDEPLFRELAELTDKGYRGMKQMKYIS
jgi:hypothetical protein